MSYLPSGKTHRTMFNQMHPRRHDLDDNKSEVLAYISQEMGCDILQAKRAFNSMRHPKCRVLVFDKIERQWKGSEFRPADAETSELSIIREHRSFERQMAILKSTIRRMQSDIDDLRQKVSAHPKRKNENNPKPEPESSENPINPNIESYSVELKNGPLTIYRDDGEPDNKWQRRKDHVLNQRVMFLNISGKSGTPEQEDYIKRMNFPPNKPPAKQANSLESIITQAWS